MSSKKDGKGATMAERAWVRGAGLILKGFQITDPDYDDNPGFTLSKRFPDGSELEWNMAMPMREILRLCQAEGIESGGSGKLDFRKAPIRIAAVGSCLIDDDLSYAVCDFPGPDAEETNLEAVEGKGLNDDAGT
jgi:hypothetical protein